ncbi:hypothetical protein HDU92_007241 [Lobulomyces angularis]|nr:hypothetical protein HDU92_007241 [Lobulomyces angularis]
MSVEAEKAIEEMVQSGYTITDYKEQDGLKLYNVWLNREGDKKQLTNISIAKLNENLKNIGLEEVEANDRSAGNAHLKDSHKSSKKKNKKKNLTFDQSIKEKGGRILKYFKHDSNNRFSVKVEFDDGTEHTFGNLKGEKFKGFVSDFKPEGMEKEE